MRVSNSFATFLSIVILFSLFAIVVYAAVDVDPNTCSFQSGSSCYVGDYGVASVYFTSSDGHVEQYTTGATSSGLVAHLCCDYNGTAPYITSGYCSHQPLFSMWSLTNSHIAQNRSAGSTYNVCATSYDGFTQCDYNPYNGACNANQTLVGTLDSTSLWNSHLGMSSALGTNICCSFNTSIMLQGINIAQLEYWCGVQDGVCPEDYYNTAGTHPTCYPREDPDC